VKKMMRWGSILLLTLALQGCLYANVRGPLDTNFDQTSLGTKTGRASLYSVLWLVSWGDAGSQAAAADGGIRVINHADSETFMVLFGLYTEVTTVVYGD